MSITTPPLRDYQVFSIDELLAAIAAGHKRIILVIPTGGGKTTISVAMIVRAVAKLRCVLFLAHRKELITQVRDRMHVFGLFPGVIMAGWKQKERPVMVASQQTLIRRILPPADVIFVDECHHSTSSGFRKILDSYPNAVVIGLTATPYRLDGKGLGSVGYTHIVAPVNIPTLIEDGFLVPAKYYGPKRDMSTAHTTGGDYNTAELYEKFNKTIIYDGVIQHYNRFAPGSKAIVFNVNVEHSQKMARLFNENGITCAHLDGETPALLRAQILSDFKDGKYQVLCNVNILTEGFDLPAIETVILNRATKSKALYLQMVGRGLRPAPGKNACIVIDQGGNVYQHGPVDQEEEYSLEDKPKKGGGAPPMKECPSCLLLMHAGAQTCKECSYVFTLPIHERELERTEFEELWLPKSYNNPKSKPRPSSHFGKPHHELTEAEFIQFANLMGYKDGWVFHQLKLQQQKQQNQIAA